MSRKPLAWYVIPGLVVAGFTALGSVGGGIIWLSKQLTVTDRVEATESKNTAQDERLAQHGATLDVLERIEAQQQEMLQALIQARPEVSEVKPWVRQDRRGNWQCCYEETMKDCTRRSWEACE